MKTDNVITEKTFSDSANELVNNIGEASGLTEFMQSGILNEAKICFVCTGNTCRSPMAAAVFNHLVLKEGKKPHIKGVDIEENTKLTAVSAGLMPDTGAPVSSGAYHALEDAGIISDAENDWKGHHARPTDEKTMKECALIIGISAAHAMTLIASFPEYSRKIVSMPHDVPDPYGGDDEAYRLCLEKIRSGLEELFS